MIRVTLDEIDRDAFQGAVDALMGAKRHLYPRCALLERFSQLFRLLLQPFV